MGEAVGWQSGVLVTKVLDIIKNEIRKFSFVKSMQKILTFSEGYFFGKPIKKGLDLQGGLYMMLGVQTQKAVESKIKTTAATISYFAEDKGILIDDLTINEKGKFVKVSDITYPKIKKDFLEI